MKSLLGLFILCLFHWHLNQVRSVIMPMRIQHSFGQPSIVSTNNSIHDEESVPYSVTILEGNQINVAVNSQSSITVNLNRAVSETVNVNVLVYSGPGLIVFDNKSHIKDRLLRDHQTTNVTITYEPDTFGDRLVYFKTTDIAGHAEIVCQVAKQPKNHIDDSSAYISVNIGQSWQIDIIISIVGWLYFFAWSLSFYFQVILNYQRKSVIGLNFDFLALNFLGFTCYSIYNFALLFSREVQKTYYQRNAYSRIPVEYNDLFFALHALLLTFITIVQCFIYERGEQRVSIPAKSFMIITSTVGLGLYITNLFDAMNILDVVLYLSYVKLAITLIKYTPQAYMNYARKATTGWSIHNILLDFTGGSLSIAQMFFLAYNYNDWVSIFGNFTKFGLGVISISFDILFVLQHYILYKQNNELLEASGDSIPEPVINQSIRSAIQGENDQLNVYQHESSDHDEQ